MRETIICKDNYHVMFWIMDISFTCFHPFEDKDIHRDCFIRLSVPHLTVHLSITKTITLAITLPFLPMFHQTFKKIAYDNTDMMMLNS